MACSNGCCENFREHVQSLGVLSDGREQWTKTTTHQTAPDMTVDVTEHFTGRQDVTVKPGVPLRKEG